MENKKSKAMFNIFSINPEYLEDILVPLGICVILPCLIVFLTMWARRNETNRKAEIAIKAIENGTEIDPAMFQTPVRRRTYKGSLFRTLKSGLVCAGLGLAFLLMPLFNLSFGPADDVYPSSAGIILLCLGVVLVAAYFIGRKMFAAEIKAEEDKLGKVE